VILVRLLGVLALICVNAFFAAAEFSLVAVRLSRLRQLVKRGNASARIVQDLVSHLEIVVSGVQVGITLTTLGLGFLGELAISQAIEPLLWWIPGKSAVVIAHAIALSVAYLLLTIFHVVLGELVPKGLSLSHAERVALLVARPFQWYLGVFRPVISRLDGMSRIVLRALGVTPRLSHTMVHSAEELLILIQQARERGLLAADEERYVQSALELGQLQVREIMVPRPDVHALPVEATLEDALQLFARTQRSRLPIYQGTLDHALGFVHIKDLFGVLMDRERRAEQHRPQLSFDLRRFVRELLIVPESKPAGELLSEFRARSIGMALVVDEFGSILGLVTLEDVVEQVVGEIHDEFDLVERPLTLPDGAMVFDASLNVRDFELQYQIALPEDPAYSTIGGFALAQLGFIPQGGETFDFEDHRFTVFEMDRRRIARLKVQTLPGISANPAPRDDGTSSAQFGGASIDRDKQSGPAQITEKSAGGDHT
jgi:CBS domain containing-hemolysin-like protein